MVGKEGTIIKVQPAAKGWQKVKWDIWYSGGEVMRSGKEVERLEQKKGKLWKEEQMEKEQLQEASLADDDNRNSCEERVDPK